MLVEPYPSQVGYERGEPMSRTPPTALPSKHVYSPEASPKPSKITKPTDLLSPLRLHRLSTQTHHSAADKAKTPIRGTGSEIHHSPLSISQAENGLDVRDIFGSYHAHATPRPTSAEGQRHKSTPKRRGSLLVAASDALSFKFGRKRQTTPARRVPTTTWLPDVMEITAHRTDAGSEERERLREEAAQSLGISVDQDTQSISQTTENDDQELDKQASRVSYSDNTASARSSHTRPDIANCSTKSLPSPVRHTILESRRPGSTMTHYRRTSFPPLPIPSFPASLDAIQEFKQLSASLSKYHTPNNLRIFAFTKNWKIRHVVLTSPVIAMTNSSEPAVSYLHVFKSSATGEREIERLEINENSVIFIAEEDVGGRRHVVKVGGTEETNLRKSQVIEDGRVTWFFHIPDVSESQRWIAAIKNVILAQRTIRAGLGLPPQVVGGIEPRGDMDVMLSIRQQGIVTTPSALRQRTSSPHSVDHLGNYASSISSQSAKSHTTGPKTPPSASPTSGGLRSIFMSRPRATSRATSSLDSERESESYLSMGHFMSKLRPSTAESHKFDDKSFVPPLSSFTSATHSLQRRIMNEHPPDLGSAKAEAEECSSSKGDRTSRALSLSGSSLQPPPRKRRGSEALLVIPIPPTTPETPDETALPQGVQPPGESPPNQRFSHFGSPQLRPRVQSAHSVSTIASGDNTTSHERSSVSTKRSSRRWSRQSVLPARPSPPSVPPPPAPSSAHLQPHLYAGGQAITRTSSNQSDRSIIPGFASFSSKSSKRTSTASAFSTKSSTSQSLNGTASRSSHPSSVHRASMPPSKPPPTSALPPAPSQATASAPPTRSLFRESVTVRVGRLSVIAPKPAPTTALPSPPTEGPSKSHRRASSGSYFAKPVDSNSSTSSLSFIPSYATTPPLPHPSGPLPPTPKTQTARHSIAVSSSSTQNENSVMRRLRMLSAPSSPPPVVHEDLPGDIPTELCRPRSNTVMTPIVHSPKPVLASVITAPATPIAEKIISFQDDPSFLQFDTPTIPSLPPRALQQIAGQPLEMTSLSPPPRRGSRQILPSEIPNPDGAAPSTPTPKPAAMDGDRRLISLSRPGSVVSLGIVSM